MVSLTLRPITGDKNKMSEKNTLKEDVIVWVVCVAFAGLMLLFVFSLVNNDIRYDSKEAIEVCDLADEKGYTILLNKTEDLFPFLNDSYNCYIQGEDNKWYNYPYFEEELKTKPKKVSVKYFIKKGLSEV